MNILGMLGCVMCKMSGIILSLTYQVILAPFDFRWVISVPGLREQEFCLTGNTDERLTTSLFMTLMLTQNDGFFL